MNIFAVGNQYVTVKELETLIAQKIVCADAGNFTNRRSSNSKIRFLSNNSYFLKQSELEKIMVYILPIIKNCTLL